MPLLRGFLISLVLLLPIETARAQDFTAHEFQRLYAHVRTAGYKGEGIPSKVARVFGLTDSHAEFETIRRSWAKRRKSDRAVVSEYAADIPLAGPRGEYLIVTEAIPDSAVFMCLVNNSGKIAGAVEVFPDRSFAVEAVKRGTFHGRCREIWRTIVDNFSE